jgi:Zinc knuckle
MDLDSLKCFRCGELGHVSAGCPKHAQLQMSSPEAPAMPWCGICDPRTRLMRGVEPTSRCPSCHPKRHDLLVQHARCRGCRKLVYAWDVADCGQHRTLGPRPYTPVARREVPAVPTQLAAQQVAEARTARGASPLT